ncbi:hypothetical protein [Enterococcus casseliflavus]|uniref:hypothetical protein n=1 Tax=Enterococcus casseliflavus TaxID=37734 RepID=UPI0022E0C818|nr:hypothetical protein [Enterococcus casseliflavus]MEB6085062.1 hypothetical protein [Enterococcus casseliflavus]
MGKILKYFFILALSIAYLIVQFVNPDFLPGYESIWTLVTVVVALALYFYNDSFFVFSVVNNALNHLWRKPQVTWELYYAFQTYNEDAFNVSSNRLTSLIAQTSQLSILNNEENYLEFEIESPDIRKYRISSIQIDEELQEITCSYKCTLSFKSSKKELDKANDFFSKLFNTIGKQDDHGTERQTGPMLINPTYTLKLSFSGYNPVYGLMVRRINQNEVKSFSLKFEQGESVIIIEKNFMEIQSENLKQLEEISKHYLALSDVT